MSIESEHLSADNETRRRRFAADRSDETGRTAKLVSQGHLSSCLGYSVVTGATCVVSSNLWLYSECRSTRNGSFGL